MCSRYLKSLSCVKRSVSLRHYEIKQNGLAVGPDSHQLKPFKHKIKISFMLQSNIINKLEKFERFGDAYLDVYLEEERKKKQKLESEEEWVEGLKFFFDRSLRSGRSNEQSQKYIDYVLNFLEKNKEIIESLDKDELEKVFDELRGKKEEQNNKKQNNESKTNLNDEVKKALEKLGLKGLVEANGNTKEGNPLARKRDILHVLDTLRFVKAMGKGGKPLNIYGYVRKRIEKGEIGSCYFVIGSLHGAGPKITSFIIRDVVLISGINHIVRPEDFNLIFPVDTWVAQVYNCLKGTYGSNNEMEGHEVLEELQRMWEGFNEDWDALKVAKIASGMWFFGTSHPDFLEICGVKPDSEKDEEKLKSALDMLFSLEESELTKRVKKFKEKVMEEKEKENSSGKIQQKPQSN